MGKPTVRLIREIFDEGVRRSDYHHRVSPGEEMVDVIYYENNSIKNHVSITLDAAEAFAEAILACAKEMRDSE